MADLSPWMDLRIPPNPVKMQMVEAQEHRRFLKAHLPVDALVFSPKAKYNYKGKNGRWKDVLSEAESDEYEQIATEKLGEACAHWLKTGEMV